MKTLIILNLTAFLSSVIVAYSQNVDNYIYLKESGIKIDMPIDWERIEIPGKTLYIREKIKSSPNYRRNILLLKLKDSLSLDKYFTKKFGEQLVSKFSHDKNVKNFTLEDQKRIRIDNDEPAIYYLTSYSQSGMKFKQMHILVSSKKYHFLATYTDLENSFENTDYLTKEAWKALSSITIDRDLRQSNSTNMIYYILFITLFGFSFIIVSFYFHNKNKENLQIFIDEDNKDNLND